MRVNRKAIKERQIQILEIVRSQPGISLPKVASSLGLTLSMVRGPINELIASRLLREDVGRTSPDDLKPNRTFFPAI